MGRSKGCEKRTIEAKIFPLFREENTCEWLEKKLFSISHCWSGRGRTKKNDFVRVSCAVNEISVCVFRRLGAEENGALDSR